MFDLGPMEMIIVMGIAVLLVWQAASRGGPVAGQGDRRVQEGTQWRGR